VDGSYASAGARHISPMQSFKIGCRVGSVTLTGSGAGEVHARKNGLLLTKVPTRDFSCAKDNACDEEDWHVALALYEEVLLSHHFEFASH